MAGQVDDARVKWRGLADPIFAFASPYSDDVEALILASRASAPFFYYSNIFSTNFTLARFSREQADENYRCFKEAVTRRFPKVILHGADVAGRWH